MVKFFWVATKALIFNDQNQILVIYTLDHQKNQ
jgi:hypothetical protein